MHFNCHSYYSLRHGVLSIEQLVKQAKLLGVKTMALTDINCSTAVFDFYQACLENEIHPVVGVEFRDKNHQLLYIGLAKNHHGLHELNVVLSQANLNKQALPVFAPEMPNCYVVYSMYHHPEKLNDNEFIGVHYSEQNHLFASSIHQEKLLAWHPVTFLNQQTERYLQHKYNQESIVTKDLHRMLRAVDRNVVLSMLGKEQYVHWDESFLSPDEMLQSFAGHPYLIRNAELLLAECSFEFQFKTSKNKKLFTSSEGEDNELLERKTLQGFKIRYKTDDWEAKERVYKELAVIRQMRFTAYFLIAWDVIRYSKSRGFYHVGRGSGANSIVAYCLGITDVDPVDLDLYFERFINPTRKSPPDFDLDFSWKDRDAIHDYMFQKYDHNHTALLGTISSFKNNSIIRELGKVFGLPKNELDQLVNHHRYPASDHVSRKILEYGAYMERNQFPNLRSIHAGGVLISELPITYYSALDLPPKGYPTVQFDMYIAEAVGLEKFDILSQRGIGHINDAVKLVKENKNEEIDIHQIEKFKHDPKVKQVLSEGKTIGCFYVESTAMRGLLRKLRCSDYLTLVAASSIIRPGVARSGMMRAYIERFHDQENIPYPHEIFKEHLSETYGVMVYQEDVIKICHYFAGIELADADIIRRAMSGKYRSKKAFQHIVDTYFKNCKQRGYSDDLALEIWKQIESFGGYSFSKGHSASYAVESYQSLYLKAYYPLEFMVGVINNFGGFYRTWVYVHEARVLGATIMVPCLNNSDYLTNLKGSTVYLGFIHVEHLERKTINGILQERILGGDYRSIEDFVDRVEMRLEQILLLIRVGAFNFTGKSKRTLMWEAHLCFNAKPPSFQHMYLFRSPPTKFESPTFDRDVLEDAFDEIELLGFTVSATSFDLLQTKQRGDVMAKDMLKMLGRKVRMMGNLVHIKTTRTIRGDRMSFGTFIDAEDALFDTTHFPPSLREYPFHGRGVYLVYGKVTEDFGHPSVEVEKMVRLPFVDDPRYAENTRLKPGKLKEES